ncbi:hypothetical protein GXB85_06645 [Cellulomonas sp. APG4]|uniref:hypothetical protein n=1 Tax=Cellulomonas sp. APG4 TaxID=1538656 RepID=UPI00137B6CEA|nr:hypothetical protein [Cellulomonas sp. APG4]NCT90621.1 hypothetical protein [Cellulomonas sp. APG4]
MRTPGRTTRRHTWPVAALGALALTLTACASLGGDDGATPAGGSGDVPADEETARPPQLGEPALEIAHVGGFVPVGWDFLTVAELTLYPDGTAVTHGPTTLEYPGRMLPNLVTHDVPDDVVTALLAQAEEAGLLSEVEYGTPPVADAGATQLTIRRDGDTWVHRAEALGIGGGPGEDGDGIAVEGLSEEERMARTTLSAFLEDVRASVADAEETGPWVPDAFAVMTRPVDPAAETADPAPTVHTWPLAQAPEECTVVDGEDATALAEMLTDARANDRVEHDGEVLELWVRVLLPGDEGCASTR